MLKWYGWYLSKHCRIQSKKHKILIVFDDMIADMLNNKKLNLIVTGLFTRGRKLNISVFITQSCFAVLKNITLNTTISLWKS